MSDGAACGDGSARCGTSCVSVTSDPTNCGACGVRCPSAGAGQQSSCVNGSCVTSCAPGRQDCDGNAANGCEADTSTDPMNCGSCRRTCGGMGGTATCVAGACSIACTMGRGNCDMDDSNGCETDVNASTANCGRCGMLCPSGANASATCNAGTCALMCNPGFADCDGMPSNGCEVQLGTAMACANCTTRCTGSTPVCNSSMACVSGCATGETRCEMSGTCANTNTSASNCGSCGNVCRFANASARCAAGVCRLGTCNAGFDNCDGNEANGCETPLGTSNAHCGGCGRACNLANATSMCTGGACVINACNTGFGNCDGMSSTGCEVNLTNTATACNSCSNRCGAGNNAVATCSMSMCGLACNMGFGNCDMNAVNGCETNVNNNVTHCGMCGNGCMMNQRCNGTSCQACPAGAERCPGSGNTCIDLRSDPMNCGICGRTCMEPMPSCMGGVCTSGCASPMMRCSGMCVDTTTSNSHCGGCGNTCSSGATCSGSTCTCSSGRALCGPAAARICCAVGERCTSGACEPIPDSGVDTGVDTGADTGNDTGNDTGSDTGTNS